MADIKDFDYVDGFRNGLARVRQGNKWGIVNEQYEVVVPIEYDAVWKFYGKSYDRIVLEKDGSKYQVSFDSPSDVLPYGYRQSRQRNYDDDYGHHYGEFAGSYAQDVMGFSDDVINDAFEGDPDMYWNID